MAKLYPEAFEKMKQMVEALAPIADSLPGAAPGFITDMSNKIALYGEEVFCSPKQLEWIKSLYAKHASSDGEPLAVDEAMSPDRERNDLIGSDDIDDDIPF